MAPAAVDGSLPTDHLPSWGATVRNSAAALLLGYGSAWGMRRFGFDPIVFNGIHLSSAVKGTAWVGTAIGVTVVSLKRYRHAKTRRPASAPVTRRPPRHKRRPRRQDSVRSGLRVRVAGLVRSAVETPSRQVRSDEKEFQRLMTDLVSAYIDQIPSVNSRKVQAKGILQAIEGLTDQFATLVTKLKPKVDQKLFRETRAELLSSVAEYFDAALVVIAEVEKDGFVFEDDRDREILRRMQQNFDEGALNGAAEVSQALRFDEVPPKFVNEVWDVVRIRAVDNANRTDTVTLADVSHWLKGLHPLLSSSAEPAHWKGKEERHWSFQAAANLICDVVNSGVPSSDWAEEVRARLPDALRKEKEEQHLYELFNERLGMIFRDEKGAAIILGPMAFAMAEGVQDMADSLLSSQMIDTYFYQMVHALTSDSKEGEVELAERPFLNTDEKETVQKIVGTSLARLMKSSWGSAALAGDRWYIPAWITGRLRKAVDRLVEKGLNNVLRYEGDRQLIKFDAINSSLADFIATLKGENDKEAREIERKRRLEATEKYLTEPPPSFSDIRWAGDKFGFRKGIIELRRVLKAYPLVWRNLLLVVVEDVINHLQPPPEEEGVAN